MKEETVLSTRGRETEGAERDEGWIVRKRKKDGWIRKGRGMGSEKEEERRMEQKGMRDG